MKLEVFFFFSLIQTRYEELQGLAREEKYGKNTSSPKSTKTIEAVEAAMILQKWPLNTAAAHNGLLFPPYIWTHKLAGCIDYCPL